jgi:glucokinase
MLVVGDVGGTKTRLGLYQEGTKPIPQVEKVYVSGDYPNLETIIQAFIDGPAASLVQASTAETGISRAVFGLPGPVNDGVVKVTNLPWTVSEQVISQTLGIPQVKLLNDLEATAYGIPFLPAADLHPINDVPPHPTSNKVVIAPGTGLGEANLIYHNGHYIASASEGGHVDFAPRNLFEIDLLRYVMEKFGHVSYERMCSGIGIPHIYNYLLKTSNRAEVPAIAEALRSTEDRTPIIMQAGLKGESAVCQQTLSTFVSILGSEAGNKALHMMAKGGVYLGGGIPPKILPALQDGTFMAAFTDKGRFSEMLAQIPVYVILNEKTALFGAACYALGL